MCPESGKFCISDLSLLNIIMGFPGGSDVKESACNAGDLAFIPGSVRSPGRGHGNLLQYSCLENPMDREAWQAMVHWVARAGHDWSDLAHTWSCDN